MLILIGYQKNVSTDGLPKKNVSTDGLPKKNVDINGLIKKMLVLMLKKI
jgi:hypothetical protein